MLPGAAGYDWLGHRLFEPLLVEPIEGIGGYAECIGGYADRHLPLKGATKDPRAQDFGRTSAEAMSALFGPEATKPPHVARRVSTVRARVQQTGPAVKSSIGGEIIRGLAGPGDAG
jgi:hypothetical protein